MSVNGRQLFEAVQTDPKTYVDVKVFAGKGLNVANAALKNFNVVSKNVVFQDCFQARAVDGVKYTLIESSTVSNKKCANGCLYYKEEDGPTGPKYCLGLVPASLAGIYYGQLRLWGMKRTISKLYRSRYLH